MRKSIIAVVIVAAILLVAAFVPLVEAEFQRTETYLAYEPHEITQTYYEQEPYQVEEVYRDTRHVSEKVIDDAYTVIRGLHYSVSVHLEPAAAVVNGLVREHTGHGIDFYVFHEVSYHAWRMGNPYISLVELSNVTSEFFTFAPSVPGDYYFVLSNRESSNEKLVRLEVYYYHPVTEERTRTVTKYRTVEKQRTVTEYWHVEKERLVTRYERVPIIEYLRSRSWD